MFNLRYCVSGHNLAAKIQELKYLFCLFTKREIHRTGVGHVLATPPREEMN